MNTEEFGWKLDVMSYDRNDQRLNHGTYQGVAATQLVWKDIWNNISADEIKIIVMVDSMDFGTLIVYRGDRDFLSTTDINMGMIPVKSGIITFVPDDHAGLYNYYDLTVGLNQPIIRSGFDWFIKKADMLATMAISMKNI